MDGAARREESCKEGDCYGVLDEMARHRPEGLKAELRDDAGRDLLAWRAEGFEILFWPDHAARELRVVEIELTGK